MQKSSKTFEVNSAALSNQIDFIEKSRNYARNHIIKASSLANALFHVDNNEIWDHLMEVSIRTIKYLNGSQRG